MFDWGSQAEFELEIRAVSDLAADFIVAGATKEAPFSYSVVTGGVQNTDTFLRRIAGIPIFLTVHFQNTTIIPGEMWVEVFLRANQVRLFKFVSGYISFDRSLSFPAGSGNQPAQEEVLPQPEDENDPAAGADFDVGPDTNQAWIIHSVSFRLVTDANAADRRAHLRTRHSGGDIVQEFFGSVNQVASTTRDYVFQAVGAVPAEEHDDIIIVPFPNKVVLNRLGDIESRIVNIQVGDQISNIKINRSTMALNN